MMYSYGDHPSWWWYALGIIGMVVFWGVLVLAIAAAVRYLDRGRQGRSSPERPAPSTPEQLLADRFARGEIDADEYRQRLDALRQARHPAASGARS